MQYLPNQTNPLSTYLYPQLTKAMEQYGINQFALSIALMFAFFGAEFAWGKFKGKRLYNFNDTLSNVLCGLFERSIFVLFAYFYYHSFTYLHNHFAWLQIPDTAWSLALLFLAIDLLWYIYHRAGHEINVLWAAHITHHQSESYNLSVSFRVSSLQLIIRMAFWSLLPLIGFNPTTTVLIIGAHAAYQFFIHTELVPKLGFLEHIFVTPSHHRVHHGRNEQYLDKNYGGVLILWDRLFGTFAIEKEPVSYGTVKAFTSIDPFKACFQWYVDLWQATRLRAGWKNKLALWFAKPEALASYDNHKSKTQPVLKAASPVQWYASVHTGLALLHLWLLYAGYGKWLDTPMIWFLVLWLAYSSWCMAQTHPWHHRTFRWEVIRLTSWIALLYLLIQPFNEALAIATSLLLPGAWFVWLLAVAKKQTLLLRH